MEIIKFQKYQGTGNDFIIVERRYIKHNPSKIAKKLCDRHFGIGGDGLIVVEKSKNFDFKMRIFNPDGSEAEMCGNGIRCFARYVIENKLTNKKELLVETLAGIIKPKILTNKEVKVNMGRPKLKKEEIPVLITQDVVVNFPFEVLNFKFNITCVSMGNPHCVIFVDNFEGIDVEKLGAHIETNPIFPNRTNVEFVRIKDKKNIEVEVWERGAGRTLACGTGACASVVAGVLNSKLERKVNVFLRGGRLTVYWNSKDDNVYLQGEAKRVFTGEIRV